MKQNLTIGRIVRYVDVSGMENAAMITGVREISVDLTVFPAGQNPYPVREVQEGTADMQGTWHWPAIERQS